jgi:hypothetical protein
MENLYNNATGTGVAPKGGVSGADIGVMLGGAVINSVIAGYFAKGENEKALKLQAELSKLSLDQQKQLEERLQDVQSETERQGMVYQFLAVQNNNEMLNRVQTKKYTSYIVLGVGVTVLALVILKLAKKKNG